MKKNKNKKNSNRSTNNIGHRYLTTFALATLFFIIGILIGYAITSGRMSGIRSTTENMRLEFLDLELQGALGEYNPCGTSFLYVIGERIDNLETRLILLEGQFGKNDESVIELKKPYTLLQIQHYLLIKKRIEKCNEDYIIILFFYSNKPEYIDDSEKQGYVLKYFADKYGYEKIKVYSIDGDLGLGIVKTLKEMHHVEVLPTTIVNDKIYVGFHPRKDFEKDF